jgi:hypothetical protein
MIDAAELLFAVFSLLCFSAMFYLLLTNPRAIAQKVEKLGWYIPYLELTKTKYGKLRVRVGGLIGLVVSIYMLISILALWLKK